MARDWKRYLSGQQVDPGRALVERGRRFDEAASLLSEARYAALLTKLGTTPREAATLAVVGRRLSPLLREVSGVRFPYRLRTLVRLSDLSADLLVAAAAAGSIHAEMTETEARALRGKGRQPVSQVIKPTDNWSFSTLHWPRIDGLDAYGYIPGDLYANLLWYYARSGDVVVDPMAGSGMLHQVWEDRVDWYVPLDGCESCAAGTCGHEDLDVRLFDLSPRGPFACRIAQCDVLDGLPVDHADYIIVDPPYCGVVNGQYSALPNDLGNMEPGAWIEAIHTVAMRFAAVQPSGGRCTVVVPNYRVLRTGERLLFPDIVRRAFAQAGYVLSDVVYASRRTQRTQSRRMGILNNRARSARVPLADMAEVLTFARATSLGEPERPAPGPLASR